MVKKANLEAPESKYRAGAHETKNPAWLQIESDYESAQQQLSSAQHALADAQAQHKKKQVIADANDAVQQAQKSVDELRHKLDTTEQSRVETVIESYHYTKKTIDLTASAEIEFQFRDRAGNLSGSLPMCIRTNTARQSFCKTSKRKIPKESPTRAWNRRGAVSDRSGN
jgi:phage-related protein